MSKKYPKTGRCHTCKRELCSWRFKGLHKDECTPAGIDPTAPKIKHKKPDKPY
jgi:hypothetical protein